MDGNIKDTPPIVFVPSAADRDRWNVLSGLLAETRTQVETRKKSARPEFDKWLAQAEPKTLAELDPNQGQRPSVGRHQGVHLGKIGKWIPGVCLLRYVGIAVRVIADCIKVPMSTIVVHLSEERDRSYGLTV